ncbi:MAG TPA: DUF1080 domain-containing protein [Phycisphaerae bacterium]|nr:DUF1080 domain-containing protein [Phycisphaerae bacterium]HRY68861.1 DUF1080 domain-containing protein [Phycisphaerae bacterium]HSA25687.1 DUF1080 domain-containing protein [Phycisphaerae bacterium]
MSKNATQFVLPLAVALAGLAQSASAQPVTPGIPLKQAGKSPLKVFILAGQSNMEGYGTVTGLDKDGKERKGTLTYLLHDPAKAARVKHLHDEQLAPVPEAVAIEATNDQFGDPAPNKRKKLRVEYTLEGGLQERTVDEGETLTLAAKPGQVVIRRATYGDLAEGAVRDVTETVSRLANSRQGGERWRVREDVWVWFNGRRGGLTAGFGADKNLFGPELQFGHVMGDALDNQVLIIKTAWGGKSLYTDFRPPSSGGVVGPNYKQMLETVDKVLADLKTEFPGYDGGGYELSGLVWWHGWNDGCDPKNAVPEYEKNLVNLINDLRRDLKAPKLPVVVGELTGPWVKADGEWNELRRAQAAAASHPEFRGNVLFTETHEFVREEKDSPGGWACHEWNNAETYFLVGNACGEAMMKLLGLRRSSPATASDGMIRIFNGKDLAGWEGAPGWWKVEDGALTSQSTPDKPCTDCNYLIWKGGQLSDFELTCDFKLGASANSGVQIRSETRPNWDTYGYQADMTGDGGLVGYVYHHKRGLIAERGERVTITADGKKEVRKIGDAAELLKKFKKEDWNQYRIICRGSEITLYVNGVLMCQITDNDASTTVKSGIIALQMHPGPPMKVQFKDIALKELK